MLEKGDFIFLFLVFELTYFYFVNPCLNSNLNTSKSMILFRLYRYHRDLWDIHRPTPRLLFIYTLFDKMNVVSAPPPSPPPNYIASLLPNMNNLLIKKLSLVKR